MIRKYPAGSMRELLVVAIPLMVSFGSQSLMSFVDRMFLTWHSEAALAATMPASMLNWSVVSFAMGVANYAGTFVAQYEGAERKDRVAAVVWQSIWLSALFGALLIVFSFSAPLIFHLANHPHKVQEAECVYFATLCQGAPAALLMTALSGFFSGRGETGVVMWVNLAAVGVNAILDFCLIFGTPATPPLGIWGAALSTVLANIFATLLFALLIIRRCQRSHYPLWQQLNLDTELSWRMIKFGIPMGMQIFVDIFGFTMFLFFVGKLGTTELAATNLAFNLNSLAFIPMLGLGTAVMTLVGRRVGEDRPLLARQTVRRAMILGTTYMGLWCIAYLAIPGWLIFPFRAYADPAEFARIEQIATLLMRFVAVYGMFDVMGIVYGYAIRGAGDALFPFLYFAAASLFGLVLPAAVVWQYLDRSLLSMWTIVTGYIMLVGFGMAFRYYSGAWQKMSVFEADLQPNK